MGERRTYPRSRSNGYAEPFTAKQGVENMTVKTIMTQPVYRNGVEYEMTANRETLNTSSKSRYRVYVGGHYEDNGVTCYDRVGQDDFDTAADCANYAVLKTAAWLLS
jgi:hypothetical protein